jgi:hypothetical protein
MAGLNRNPCKTTKRKLSPFTASVACPFLIVSAAEAQKAGILLLNYQRLCPLNMRCSTAGASKLA